MNLFSSKKIMLNLVSGSLLLIGASATQAATFTCQSCENSFISGSVSLDDNRVWDWTKLEFNFGKEGSLNIAPFSSLSSNNDSTSNTFNFSYIGIEPFENKFFIPLAGDIVGKPIFPIKSTTSFLKTIGSVIQVDWLLNLDFLDQQVASGSSNFVLETLEGPVSPSAVPVPASAFLFAPALLGFAALRRKKAA